MKKKTTIKKKPKKDDSLVDLTVLGRRCTLKCLILYKSRDPFDYLRLVIIGQFNGKMYQVSDRLDRTFLVWPKDIIILGE